VLNVKVSDTTNDATRTKADNKNDYLYLLKKN